MFPSALDTIPEFRVFSREECVNLIARTLSFASREGDCQVRIDCWGNEELRWGRNRISIGSDRRDVFVSVVRILDNGRGQAFTNQLDDVSLAAVVHAAERAAKRSAIPFPVDMPTPFPMLDTPAPTVWSDTTAQLRGSVLGEAAVESSDRAEAQGMISAGYLEKRAACTATYTRMESQKTLGAKGALSVSNGLQYSAMTQAQCSMTVRHPKGTGSGWAGLSSYDWSPIDPRILAQRALDKCLASIDPRRIEPGRYTVVLEPQAVCNLVDLLMVMQPMPNPLSRPDTEKGIGPFVLGPDPAVRLMRTKIGMKLIDERITISHDPMAPGLGVVPEPGLAPVTWFDRGHLMAMTYPRDYALADLNDNQGNLFRPSYRMSGGTTSIEDMIQTTARGLLVSRFSNLRVIDNGTLLATGVTRDGLWLIENGKITTAVNNMRITESPLFVLNQVVQLGLSVPVFRPIRFSIDLRLSPAIVPPIKANDFSFTSTIDAV